MTISLTVYNNLTSKSDNVQLNMTQTVCIYNVKNQLKSRKQIKDLGFIFLMVEFKIGTSDEIYALFSILNLTNPIITILCHQDLTFPIHEFTTPFAIYFLFINTSCSIGISSTVILKFLWLENKLLVILRQFKNLY